MGKVKGMALKRCKAIQKDTINKYLSISGNTNGVAVVLDGPTRSTQKELTKGIWDKSQIHIPCFSQDYKKIVKHHKQTYDMSMFDFLMKNRNSSKKIGLLYLDYMCTFHGNISCRPKKDLSVLFANKMLLNGSFLAVTFSLRTHLKVRDDPFINPVLNKVSNYINTQAYDNGYVAIQQDIGGVYRNEGSNMFTQIYSIYKR